SPETPLFFKNKTLYGLNFARCAIAAKDRVLVVEGYMDTIAAQDAGFENTVATMGTALTEEHVNIISRFTKNVILSFDADSAGMNAALRSSPIFERAGFNVRILTMPKGEDPDSILRGGDSAKFAAMLEKTLPVPDFRIKLIFSKYDISSEEGKATALKEIILALAEIDSVVERERLIRHLARFHPNFSTGTTLAEGHIRSEIAKHRSRFLKQNSSEYGRTKKESEAALAKPEKKLSLVERSERQLLGIIIFQQADVSKVFDALPAKEFIDESSRLLAEAVNKQYAYEGKIDRETLRGEVAGTSAESLLNDILIGLDYCDMKDTTQQLVEVIIQQRKLEKRHRLRSLADSIAAGEIKHGDAEYEEWAQLVKETSGPWRR
ncbi:MAG: toprim domain-containing protein, partial [Armatimonadetes bacterium]|nr:toprim domain-containing protein [Armatimonadota bacterium]